MNLSDIRDRIDNIDNDLIRLLNERMQLADEVAKAKIISGAAVLSQTRENEILNKIEQLSKEYSTEIKAIIQGTMTMSRERQYQLIMNSDMNWQLMQDILNAKAIKTNVNIVAYSGKVGSYGEAAARKMYPEASCYNGYKSFYDACQAVINGDADIAVLPLENTTAGTVNEVYDLIPNNLYVVKSMSDTIKHSLLVTKGAELQDIHTVISHPQALSQCSNLIKQYDWKVIECENTAYAAEEIAIRGDKGFAAIASVLSAEVHNLDILDVTVNNEMCNQTRFVALSSKLIIDNDADKISIAFKLPHKAGALAWVLYIFAGLSINLTKIQSRPITNKPWEYIFYADFLYNDENRALQALYQLEKELPEMILLGWYREI